LNIAVCHRGWFNEMSVHLTVIAVKLTEVKQRSLPMRYETSLHFMEPLAQVTWVVVIG